MAKKTSKTKIKVKDLKTKKQPKGGFNPQPEPPGKAVSSLNPAPTLPRAGITYRGR